MADKDSKGVVPSGSISVNDLPDDSDTKSTPTDDKDTKPSGDTKKDTGQDTGKKDDQPDYKQKYDELKKTFDRQANELGDLRTQVKAIQDAQAGGDKGGKDTKKDQKPDANDQLGKVLEEYGSLDFYEDDDAPKKGAELMKKAIGLTAQMVKEDTLREADSTVRNILQEKDRDTVTNRFLEENPDFTELQNQGVFQAFKTKNPLHDDFSAYHAYKADTAMQRVAQLEQELEEAKKVANLAGGDESTSKVFTKPGSDLRTHQKPKSKSVSELKQSALEAVRKAAGAG